MQTIHKLLVANRGEIAVRVFRACRERGIATVAVYSDADRAALHVRVADEAVHIGPTAATQSYLRAEAIIAAAQQTGANAIHPGYGFLSERAHLAQACADAGIIWVGPSAQAIADMGSKIAAKRLAIAHAVPVVPGYEGDDQTPERLAHEAARIGYPLLIKASAGGGGKGMRTVFHAEDFQAALEAAQREAQAAFGSAQVLLEKLILRARHVEIQVLGDQHGNVVYLGERECSIQRRYQKIIEEAPSSALSPALRQRMGEAAVRAAQAVGYTNAGTVEFMLDADENFYFLEMNTRLQVEHPVTEAITGLDLVHLQFLVAEGHPLPFSQEKVQLRGHAIEARIYAEDPVALLPSVGLVRVFVPPIGPGIRNDVGLAAGDEVTTAYDPMLAKLIVHAPDRATATQRMQRALDDYAVLGVTTNIPLLQAICAHPAWAAGDTFTDFLTLHPLSQTLGEARPTPDEVLLLAALWQVEQPASADPWQGVWALHHTALTLRFHDGTANTAVRLHANAEGYTAEIGERQVVVQRVARRDSLLVARIAGHQHRAHLARTDDAVLVAWQGQSYRLALAGGVQVDDLAQPGAVAGHAALAAPMPGTIINVLVSEGQRVAARAPLVVMEAMKMEHTLTAPHAGIVTRLPFKVGQTVQAGVTLVELQAEE